MVKRQNHEINLSATEYELLKYLAENANRVVPKNEVAKAVWKDQAKSEKLVDVYVGYVRHKIDRAFPLLPPLLHTIKGRGYRLGKVNV
jgi:two-component system, OmpR family, response regulator